MPRRRSPLPRRAARLALLAATIALGVAPASALARDGGHDEFGGAPVIGHVYLDGNTAGANTVAVLDRHAGGALTPDPASPVAAGGAGLGTGLASQGAVALALHGRYLLAADAGSNQISVLRVGGDGELRPVDGGPVDAGGVEPVSITVHRHLVYVADRGGSGPGADVGFYLTDAGQLLPIPGATFALPAGTGVGDIVLSPDGTRLIDARVAPSQIDSFAVGRDGGLTPAPGSPYPAQGLGPFGSAFSPTAPDDLYVSNAHNGTGLGTVSAFRDGPDGTLSSIGASPFADGQTAPCWVAITPDGRDLFAVNTASGTISGYGIAPDGSLGLLGTTSVSESHGVGAVDAVVSRDGRDLYVNESAAHTVAAFAISKGALSELATSPTPLPASITAPAGIVASDR